LKKVKSPCQIEFVRLKSYDGTQSTEQINEIFGLQVDITDKDIIIIEDIVDTGHTLDNFLKKVATHNPKSVKIASLIFKKEAFQKDFPIDFLGFEIENKFIVGYGLDYNEYGRNYPEIYQII
jgi:hypoxanthine phosphoribosyltransferase